MFLNSLGVAVSILTPQRCLFLSFFVQVEEYPEQFLTPSWPSPSTSPAAATRTWSTVLFTGWDLF